jgi:hypothetical protein
MLRIVRDKIVIFVVSFLHAISFVSLYIYGMQSNHILKYDIEMNAQRSG